MERGFVCFTPITNHYKTINHEVKQYGALMAWGLITACCQMMKEQQAIAIGRVLTCVSSESVVMNNESLDNNF